MQCDHVFLSHAQVQIAARKLHDLHDELLQDPVTSTIEGTSRRAGGGCTDQ
jgi:hypothetical protein